MFVQHICKWCRHFQASRTDVKDSLHSGQPKTSNTDEFNVKMAALIEEDDLITIWEITASVGITYDMVTQIIRDDLHFWKICMRWISHTLTAEKMLHVATNQQNLVLFRREENTFRKWFVSGDESWVLHYNPLSKHLSLWWQWKNERCKVKVNHRASVGKIGLTLFFDYRGTLLVEFIHRKKRINSYDYTDTLM